MWGKASSVQRARYSRASSLSLYLVLFSGMQNHHLIIKMVFDKSLQWNLCLFYHFRGHGAFYENYSDKSRPDCVPSLHSREISGFFLRKHLYFEGKNYFCPQTIEQITK